MLPHLLQTADSHPRTALCFFRGSTRFAIFIGFTFQMILQFFLQLILNALTAKQSTQPVGQVTQHLAHPWARSRIRSTAPSPLLLRYH